MHGLYVHIPFCRSKCDYCGFFSIPLNGNKRKNVYLKSYMAALNREIDIRLNKDSEIIFDTVYFGGGTPSLAEPEDIKLLLDHVSGKVKIAGGAEISMEINPEDVIRERLIAYREAGVNRFILGVQTLNEKLHSIIGRSTIPCTERMLDDYFSVREIIHCLDLIIGIPGQSEKELIYDIDKTTEFRPSHISAYILSVEEGTPLFKKVKKNIELEEHQSGIYYKALSLLEGKGYDHYEISNFALPGFESKHNMKYWSFLPYVGIGAGAHSFYDNERYSNSMSAEEYIGSPEPRTTRDIRTGESPLIEYILTGLRLTQGISLTVMKRRFKIGLSRKFYENLESLSGRGLIIFDNEDVDEMIKLSREGFIIADSIILEIVKDIM